MLEDPQRTPNSKNDGDNFPHLYSTVNSNKNLINQAQGLVGYWSFDEGRGNIARDYSGNGNDGTLYNFNFTATSGWVDGKVGKALSFDGVDDIVSVPNTFPSTNQNKITIVTWYRWKGGSYSGIVSRGWCSSMGWLMHGYYGFGVNDNTGCSAQYFASFGTLTANIWYFLVGIFDGNKVYAFRDGNLINTRNAPSVNLNINNYQIRIGELNPGLIDELRIYNRALSDSEIKALYEATK